jgi:hypothetical protein
MSCTWIGTVCQPVQTQTIIIPTLLDFYIYGWPIFNALLLYIGLRDKRRFFYKMARRQFIVENAIT